MIRSKPRGIRRFQGRFVFGAAIALTTAAVAACGPTDPLRVVVAARADQVDTVDLQPPTAVATQVGQQVQFTAVPLDERNQEVDATVSWTSSDLTVASVDRLGVATAFAAGDTEIRATSGGRTGRAVLTVLPTLIPQNP